MNELGPEARELLDAARDADVPSESDRRRVRTALLAKIAAGTVVGASATAASSSAAAAGGGGVVASTGGAMLAVKIVAAVALVGGGVTVPIVALQTHESEPHVAQVQTPRANAPRSGRAVVPVRDVSRVGGVPSVPAPAALAVPSPEPAPPAPNPAGAPAALPAPVSEPAPPVPNRAVAPAALPAPGVAASRAGSGPAATGEASNGLAPGLQPRPSVRETRRDVAQRRARGPVRASEQTPTTQMSSERAARAPAAPERVSGELAGEAAVLRSALASIRDGRAEDAVAALDRHAESHPSGVLAQERMAARIRALRAMGRTAEADGASVEFLRRWPTSPLAPRVRAERGR
ncbi:MAG: hypothetical protein IT379_23265 [Deltaproteobacteria bacterium]|nr:hypothetical protein [Deltaproteobacteria bacterium]